MTILDVQPKPGQPVYVYEFPVRIWHWAMAACVFTLFVTGYLIYDPPQSLTGDPTYIFSFGEIIRLHYAAGLILCVAMTCRVIWAFFGNVVSRQIFIIKFWKKSWWRNLLHNIKWYCFLTDKPKTYMGHNPLAQLGMVVAIAALFFMCLTGLGIYQAKGYSLGAFRFMEDFIYWAGGNGLDLVVLHRLGMAVLMAFVIVHLYMVIRESIMGDTTMIYTMVTGWRLVRGEPGVSRWTLKAEARARGE